jgi:hypothetical protein
VVRVIKIQLIWRWSQKIILLVFLGVKTGGLQLFLERQSVERELKFSKKGNFKLITP